MLESALVALPLDGIRLASQVVEASLQISDEGFAARLRLELLLGVLLSVLEVRQSLQDVEARSLSLVVVGASWQTLLEGLQPLLEVRIPLLGTFELAIPFLLLLLRT